MTWSYTGNPADSNKDQARFYLQDTDVNDQLMTDEELNFLISTEGSPISAALRGAEILLARFANCVDETVGGVSVKLSQKMDQYKKLRDDLRKRIAIGYAIPFAGGLDYSQKHSVETNDDRVEPFFTRDSGDFQPQPDENVGPAINQSIQDEEDP